MLNIFKRRNFRFGILSTVITAAVIIFIAILNAAVTAVFNRFPLNIDLTENKIFEVSEETKDFLDSLDTDIEIFVLNTEDRFTTSSPVEYFVQANEVIRKYAQISSKVKLTYIDLLRNPAFASQYPDFELQVNDILITAGSKRRVLSWSDLFNIRSSQYGRYVASSRAEQSMTSALLGITSSKITRVLVLDGHGEEDVSALVDLLTVNAWESGSLYLPTEDIPGDASALILAAPRRDLSIEETRKLDAFLEGGNNRILFYLAPPNTPSLPYLDSFLAEWGIGIQTGIVLETNNARIMGNYQYYALGEYAEDTYSKNMARQELLPLIALSRPLEVLFESRRYRSVKPLIRMSPTSVIYPLDAGPNWVPDERSMAGNVPVLVLSTSRRNNVEGDIVQNHVLVSGSLESVGASMLGSPGLANSGYFLELLGTLAGREDRIFVMDKTVGFTELGATAGDIGIMAIIFVVLLPLVVLGAGITVWLRRRHK